MIPATLAWAVLSDEEHPHPLKHPKYLWTGEALQGIWGFLWFTYTSFSTPKTKITKHSRLLILTEGKF